MRWFVDTNVIVYTRTLGDPVKSATCREWLSRLRRSGGLVLSPQVINETIAQLNRGVVDPASRAENTRFALAWLPWCEARLDRETEASAATLHERYRLSWWDSVLVASALQVAADRLLSEDLQHDQIIGKLRIVNPFMASPTSTL